MSLLDGDGALEHCCYLVCSFVVAARCLEHVTIDVGPGDDGPSLETGQISCASRGEVRFGSLPLTDVSHR